MNVYFLSPAEDELDDAFHYYQNILEGLGQRFIEEVSASIDRVKQYPSAYPIIGKFTRRCLVRNFPYGIIYQHQNDETLIVAVSHLHRKPNHWSDRKRSE